MKNINDAANHKGAGLFLDSEARIAVALFAADGLGSPAAKFEAYAGKWNVRWSSGEDPVLSYDVEITEDGKMIRLDKEGKKR